MHESRKMIDGPDNPIVTKLRETIDELHRNVQKVEIWAGALSGFAQPVAAYEIDDKYRLPVTSKGSGRKTEEH